MSWVWRFESADGTLLSSPPSPLHGSQSDAESWLGENWRELAEAGVVQVSLHLNGELVYGPMPLSES
jgi:hypothetical protein